MDILTTETESFWVNLDGFDEGCALNVGDGGEIWSWMRTSTTTIDDNGRVGRRGKEFPLDKTISLVALPEETSWVDTVLFVGGYSS